jgi:hypothetical protein
MNFGASPACAVVVATARAAQTKSKFFIAILLLLASWRRQFRDWQRFNRDQKLVAELLVNGECPLNSLHNGGISDAA